MDAWTVFGLVKLFLDVIDGGPRAAVKGVLIMGVPGGAALDVGEVVYGVFGLDGRYSGARRVSEAEYIPLHQLELVNRGEVARALAKYDFPALAQRQFGRLDNKAFNSRTFPKMEARELAKVNLPKLKG